MEHPRPQLSFAELKQLRWLLGGLLGLLSAWTVFYMDVDAMLALAVLTFIVPVFTRWPRLATALPAWVHRLAFPLIVTVFALDWWQNKEPLPAMIRLDLMLLGYRCVSPRGRREDLQLILLALFAVVVTGVFTVSIAFVVQILLFTGCALALLLAVTISDSRENAEPAAAAGWERVRWRDLIARVRAVADWRVVALGSGLFAGVVVLSTLLFLAIPRFEITNSLFLDRLISRKSQTGFTDTVRFGEVTAIQKDDSMAFAVDLSDPTAAPAEPYWRMVVLDEYSGEGFRTSRGLREEFNAPGERMAMHPGVWRVDRGQVVWTVFYQPGVSSYLPLLGGFGRITFGEAQALGQSRSLRLARLATTPAKVLGYRIEDMDTSGAVPDRRFARRRAVAAAGETETADTQEAEVPGEPPSRPEPDRPPEFIPGNVLGPDSELPAPPPMFVELPLERPEDIATLRRWVEEFGGRGEGGTELAGRAGRWLQERHDYSLNSSLEEGEGDILVRWMGSRQPGHCELFAGSLVLLARAAGVPARMVTGFKGGAWNPVSGSIRVLNSDAHAWCEVWDDNVRSWLRVDPTPGSAMTAADAARAATAGIMQLPEDRSWSARLDGLKIFWYRRVVNFDSATQVSLLRTSKEIVQSKAGLVRVWVDERIEAFLKWVRQPWDWPRYAGFALAVSVGFGSLWFWRRHGRAWWLGWRSRRAGEGGADPVRREAARWLARLERVERRRAADGGDATARASFEAARERLLRLRFGARESWGAPLEIFREARQACREMGRSAS